MSAYNIFPEDFIIRTRKNLDNYCGAYEITELINSSIGLLFIPHQLRNDNLEEYEFNENDEKYGFSKNCIKLLLDNDYSLKNVLKHLRNGIAHGRIEQETMSNKIVGLRIFDKYPESESNNFEIELTVKEFSDFTIKLSDSVLTRAI